MAARSTPAAEQDRAEHVRPNFEDAIFGTARRRRTASNPKPISSGASLQSALRTTEVAMRKINTELPNRRPTRAGEHIKRPDSPDVGTILANTPRPRRRSSAAFSPSAFRAPSRNVSAAGAPSSWKAKPGGSVEDISFASDLGVLVGDAHEELAGSDEELQVEKELEDDGSESDSSIDLHTPLPHLMFRDGLLSPRSKLLPQGPGSLSVFPHVLEEDSTELDRARSVLSVASTAGSIMTKSGLLYKDPRDTERRRMRHKDGQLLRAGMGLTTGLGWSDSEDEDAPSTLTRKLIHTSIARRPSTSLSRPLSAVERSPVVTSPSQSPSLASPFLRKAPSNVLNRSASASLSSLRRPSTGSSNSSSDVRPSRNRTTSSASVTSTATSDISVGTPPALSASTSSGMTNTRQRARLPKSSEMQAMLTKHRAASSSASTSAIPTSVGSSTFSKTEPVGAPTSWNSSRSTKASQLPPSSRNRSLSSTSSASTGSLRSNTSGSSASTISGSSSTTTSAMRPLQLPRTTGTQALSGSTPTPGVSSRRRTTSEHQRARTLSTSRSIPTALTKATLRSIAPSTAVLAPIGRSSGTRSPTELTRAFPSPPSSMKARPLVAGPRPKPRTGTGMVYRTSSYSSLHATAMHMRSVSVTSPGSSSGVMF